MFQLCGKAEKRAERPDWSIEQHVYDEEVNFWVQGGSWDGAYVGVEVEASDPAAGAVGVFEVDYGVDGGGG
jgi:hypothetical protein